jgi:hypothetical protein
MPDSDYMAAEHRLQRTIGAAVFQCAPLAAEPGR